MLSTQLHKHIDSMDEIEAQAQAEIDKIIAAIDVKELIQDPHKAMADVADEINKIMVEKYIALAVSQGFDLVKVLEKLDKAGKNLKVDPSKDPTKNKEVVNA